MSKVTDWFLRIEWDVEGMPGEVGPFASESEADNWAQTNIPNGSWQIVPLAAPYAKARGRVQVLR